MSDLSPAQQRLVDCYEDLENLLTEHRDDLAPFEERNAIKALGTLWQVVNGLDRNPGQLYDLGV